MNRIRILLAAMAFPAAMMAQGWPAGYGGVMLQGFYWDSYTDTQWGNLEAQADELSRYFDLVWVPQSGNCNTAGNVMGYAPVYWYDQNSSFGTEAGLRSMIAAFRQRNVGVIADVVINHRGSLGVDGSWVDFPAETYKGTTYSMGLADICIDDDGGETARHYAVTGARDTGEDWSGMRDLDHTSANVQNNVLAYLGFLKDDLGYAGFRYDMTKGYGAQYTGLYNSAVNPMYSVGEYWDGNVSAVERWIDGTKVDGAVQSATFDFPTRYSIRDACNGNDWSKLAVKGLAGYDAYKRYAVTFVDNHDTQYRSSSYAGDPVSRNVMAANAYMLCMPGTPCVFLPHWKSYKEEIKQLITARKLAGVTNQSLASVGQNSQNGYSVYVGDNMYASFGPQGNAPTAVYTLVQSGENYKVYLSRAVESPWVSRPSGTYESAFSVTLTALTNDASARLVYTTDGSEPTASGTAVASGTSIDIAASTTLKVGMLTGGAVRNVVSRTYEIKPFVAHSATVYVKADNWPAVYIYAWANDAGNTELNGSWPGRQASSVKEIDGVVWDCQSFDITKSGYSFNIVLSQGSNVNQTVDIGPISDDKYYEVSADKTNGKFTVTDVTSVMTGIGRVPADGNVSSGGSVSVHSPDGRCLRTMPQGTSVHDAVSGLGKGIYIVNGRKIVK